MDDLNGFIPLKFDQTMKNCKPIDAYRRVLQIDIKGLYCIDLIEVKNPFVPKKKFFRQKKEIFSPKILTFN